MLACALLMEASTPFVSFRAILYNLHLRKSLTYVLNGLAMVVVFFSCRILIYPWFYYVHASALGNESIVEAVMKTPPRCLLYMLLALLPQLYWFKIMLTGAIKVVLEQFGRDKLKENSGNNNIVVKNDTKTD